jgi:branched-chain amino acid transport system ATP-binding protein
MDVVRSLADRIVVLHNGSWWPTANPPRSSPRPIVQEAYLGQVAPKAEAAHG